jgi:quercetin dioxygenase-like cupin family protein
MSLAELHLPSLAAGMALVSLAALLVAALLFGTRNSLPRRMADALLNRRGFEKLGESHRVLPRDTEYERWLTDARKNIPVRDCMHIGDVRSVSLEPWEQEGAGVTGVYLRLADYQVIDARILEIPAAGTTHAQRHLYEMVVHVLEGAGYTDFGAHAEYGRVDWRSGQVFSVPLNSEYRHHCLGDGPARLLSFTTFPLALNSTGSEGFIFDNPYSFDHRLQPPDGTPESTGRVQDLAAGALLDARGQTLGDHRARGAGVRARYFRFAGNSMISLNLSEMPAESIKRAHRANSDAVVLMLGGEGRLVAWPDGAWHRRIEIEWREGTLMAIPIYWYRQFINTGDVPARNLTASARQFVERLGLRLQDQRENDLPAIRRLFRSILKAKRRNV